MKQIKNLLRRPRKISKKVIFSILCFFTIFSYQSLFAQCDPGTTLAEFTWEGAATGSQSVWNVDDVSNTYTGIDGTNLDITLALDDPFNQNTDSGNLSDFGDATESNGFYGPGFLSFQVTSSASNQDVCFTYNFSTPVYIGEFLVRDIDSNGQEGTNGTLQSFQDQVTLSATGIGGGNVPLTLTPEGPNPVFTITGQTAAGNYTDGVTNGVAHTDPNGGLLVSTPELLTSLTLCYSNGPDDLDGLSNSNAIAVPGSNFCIPEPATISGIVVDDNGDPLAGAIVTLQNLDGTTALDLNGNPITVTTGPDGTYLFEDVAPGDYNIVETDPSGYVSDSSSDNTTDGALDGETGAGTDENTIPVSIIGGEDDTGNDFVDELLTGSISGTVLEDTNNDGVGDAPIPGVTIALLDNLGNPVLDDMGNPITTVTAADGTYSFDDVPPGDYQVSEVDGNGFISVSDTDGANDNIIGDGTPINVVGGEDSPGNDFVDEQTGSISGTVLEDTNNDGVGDAPIPGVTIALLDDLGNPVLDDMGNPITTVTAADGTYSFDDVPPGDYQVSEVDGNGFISVSDTDGANDNIIGDGTPINVVGGEDSPGNDFVDEQTGSISGTVLEDTNNDGVGDAPIAGVTIALLDNLGNPVLDDMGNPITTVTAADGTYSFDDVPPGDYQVSEVDENGFISVSDTDGANDNIIGDGTPINVVGGEDSPGNDFVDEQTGSISGTVLEDTNNDGVGDAPIAGVTIALLDNLGNPVLDDMGNPITTVTAADGTYSFDNVPPGDYQVSEVDENGFISVSDTDGANDNIIGDGTPINVVGGEDSPGNDFVDEQTGSISGTVLEDTDNDGVGDAPLGGVTISLQDLTGAPILDDMGNPITTVTAADGTYSFDNVPPGDYQVLESDPTGYVSISDTDGGNDNCIGNTIPISVIGGEDTPGNDFVDAAVVVPVELISFTADMRGDYVNLEWLTANETNNSHFEVERSVDGSDFHKVGKVIGHINSQTRQSYNFMDTDIPAITNTLYYRLKQVDLNGFYTHTKTVAVGINKRKIEFKATIFPNPADSEFVISYENDTNESTQLTIYNMQGQVVMTREYYSNVSIDISSLNYGNYIVKLSNQKGEQITRRIIKN